MDGERLAIALALEEEVSDMIDIVSDSQAAIQTVYNLNRGHRPRSHIECRIKAALKYQTTDIGILWIRAHIGIPGNEKADKRAEYESILGAISGKDRIAGTSHLQSHLQNLPPTTRVQPKNLRVEPALPQRLYVED